MIKCRRIFYYTRISTKEIVDKKNQSRRDKHEIEYDNKEEKRVNINTTSI